MSASFLSPPAITTPIPETAIAAVKFARPSQG
jgi:hypothetical protein